MDDAFQICMILYVWTATVITGTDLDASGANAKGFENKRVSSHSHTLLCMCISYLQCISGGMGSGMLFTITYSTDSLNLTSLTDHPSYILNHINNTNSSWNERSYIPRTLLPHPASGDG